MLASASKVVVLAGKSRCRHIRHTDPMLLCQLQELGIHTKLPPWDLTSAQFSESACHQAHPKDESSESDSPRSQFKKLAGPFPKAPSPSGPDASA